MSANKRKRLIKKAEEVMSRGDRYAVGYGLIPWSALPKSTRREVRARWHDRAVELVDALLAEGI